VSTAPQIRGIHSPRRRISRAGDRRPPTEVLSASHHPEFQIQAIYRLRRRPLAAVPTPCVCPTKTLLVSSASLTLARENQPRPPLQRTRFNHAGVLVGACPRAGKPPGRRRACPQPSRCRERHGRPGQAEKSAAGGRRARFPPFRGS
jgi:hypothetical protein